MPASTSQLSTSQLRQAFELSERIDSLQQRLNTLLGGSGGSGGSEGGRGGAARTGRGGRGGAKGKKMSAEARARIAAAQRARWAQRNKGQGATKATTGAGGGKGSSGRKGASARGGGAGAGGKQQPSRKGGGMTPEARARIAEAMRARWAAKRKANASSTATPAAAAK